jgi:hypothetical protein
MMYGLPVPPDDRTIFCFDIGESKDNSGAEWLLEEWDIDPAAPMQIPATKTDRVEIVCDTIDLFLEYPLCIRIVFCATVCNEVDAIKPITPDAWRSEFKSDCIKEYPPCMAYDISR